MSVTEQQNDSSTGFTFSTVSAGQENVEPNVLPPSSMSGKDLSLDNLPADTPQQITTIKEETNKDILTSVENLVQEGQKHDTKQEETIGQMSLDNLPADTPQQNTTIKEETNKDILTSVEKLVKEGQKHDTKQEEAIGQMTPVTGKLEDYTKQEETIGQMTPVANKIQDYAKQEETIGQMTPAARKLEFLETPLPKDPIAPAQGDDFIGYFWSLLIWESKLKSGIVVAFGLFCFYMARIWFYVYQKNFCSMICNGLLVMLGVNLIGSFFTPKWSSKMGNIEHSLAAVTFSILASNVSSLSAQLYDIFINAENSWTTLIVLMVLWALRSLGNVVGTFYLSLFVFIASFVIAPLYKNYQTTIHTQEGKFTEILKNFQRRLQLSRAHTLAALTIFAAIGWPFSSEETRLCMVLTVMVVLKCNLRPEEIKMFEEKLAETVAPLVQTVQRSMATVIKAAQEEGIIPTPQKATSVYPSRRILFADSPDISEKKTL